MCLPCIVLDNTEVVRVQQNKLFGVMLSNDLKWQEHVDYVCAKGSQRLYFVRMLKRARVGPKDIVRIYVSLVRSVLEYACQVWHTQLTVQKSDQLEDLYTHSSLFPLSCRAKSLIFSTAKGE